MGNLELENEVEIGKIELDVIGVGGGTANHSELQNLDYDNAGHTGFQREITDENKLSSDLIDTTGSDNQFVTENEKTEWNAKYDKPVEGIPANDLDNSVQTSLGLADTALQSISSSDVTTALGYTPYDSANPSGFITNTVNNLTNYELKTATGNNLNVSIDSSTYVMTIQLRNSSDVVLSTQTVDLPLESMVIGASYDSQTKELVLTLQNGNTTRISVADLVSGLQTEITSQNKLSADLVDDTNSTNKFITAEDISKLNNIESGAEVNTIDTITVNDVAQTITNKSVNISVPTAVSQLTNDSGYTTNEGTITGITMNGVSKGTSGVVDLGTVITEHQDISGKEDKTNKVTSMSASSTNTQYPSAKAVYDALHSDILHYKGHVNSVEDLPSTGQPSAEVVEPSLGMYSSEFILGSARANKDAFDARLTSDAKSYAVMLGSRYSQESIIPRFTFALRVCSDNENMILGIFPYITQSYKNSNFGKVALHVDASPEKPVLAFLDASNNTSSYCSQVLFDDGTTQNISSSSTYTFTKPFWVGFARTSTNNGYASLYTNITTPLRFHGAPQLKTGDGTGNFFDADYSTLQTYKQLDINKNYADGYVLFSVNNNYSLSYYTGEPSPNAAENNVYTVGANYDIYRCNAQPQWEHWSAVDLSPFEQTSNKVTGVSASSTNTEYPSAKAVYDAISEFGGDAVPVNSIFRYDGNTVPDGYVEVSDADGITYSTSEVRTNDVWVDGRPIYRRTFTGNTGNSAFTVMTTEYYNGMITIINSYGSLGTASGKVPLNSYVNSSWATGLFIHNEELQIYHGTSCRNGTYDVTIEFVKTSDLQGGN